MKTKKISYPPINIATSFMLVIFIILCMVIFAVLSFSNAVKDLNYSNKNAQRTSAYYEANNQAEELLASIDAILSENTTIEEASSNLQTLESISLETSNTSDTILISYSVPIDESETLRVILEGAVNQKPHYTILSWKQCSTTEWSGEQMLPLMK